MVGSTLRFLKCCFDAGLTGEPSKNELTDEDAVEGVLVVGVFDLFFENSSVHLLGDVVFEPGADPVSNFGTGEDPTLVN